jgi:hypothetical protein
MTIATTSLAARAVADGTALTYLAAFGTLPDGAGLDYQVDQQMNHGLSAAGLANQIVLSPQFTTLHAGQSTEQIIGSFYTNLLHRSPDAAGLAYQVGEVSKVGLAGVLLNFTTSPEAATVNANGLLRFEQALSNGTLAAHSQAQLDNSPAITVVYSTTTTTVVAPTPTFQAHGSLGSPLLLNAGGKLLMGDGTTPNSGMVVGATADGYSVAMREAPRSSDKVFYATNVTTSGNHVTADYTLPAGTQTVANGSSSDAPTRTAITQAFIIGSTGKTIAQAIAAGDTFNLQLDQDAGVGTNYVGSTFKGVLDVAGVLQWINTTAGAGSITDNVGNANAAGNSTLVGFHNPAGVAGATDGATYTDKLWISNAAGVELVGVTINEHLAAFGSAGMSASHTI